MLTDFSKMFLGFDYPQIQKYPPHNVIKAEDEYIIELALAGYSREDLSVTLENDNLVIKGKKPAEDDLVKYIYNGIAARSFKKIFVLSDGVKIDDCILENGILSIYLTKITPDNKATVIEINEVK